MEALSHLLLPDVAASVRSVGNDRILPTQAKLAAFLPLGSRSHQKRVKVMTTLAFDSQWALAVAFLSEMVRPLSLGCVSELDSSPAIWLTAVLHQKKNTGAHCRSQSSTPRRQ